MEHPDMVQEKVKRIFAQNLNYYMALKGKTRLDISSYLPAPYTTVCSWVDGRAYPRMDKLEKLAVFLGVNKSELVEEHPDRAVGGNDAANTIKQAMKDRPELKALFEASTKVSDAQIKKAIQVIEVFMAKK